MDKLHQQLHPDEPWLTPLVVRVLDKHLTKEMAGLEFGSGKSTAWFARRLSALTSVEHSQDWFNLVKQQLDHEGLNHVRYILADPDRQGDYENVADSFPDGSLDFILIDGINRGKCAIYTIEKLKPGGIMVIDDVHRYLPGRSRAPLARNFNDGPVDQDWQEFLDLTLDWEYIWTSNRVKDTVIYYKPMMDWEVNNAHQE
jgi:SAM-dependent methyltransferase